MKNLIHSVVGSLVVGAGLLASTEAAAQSVVVQPMIAVQPGTVPVQVVPDDPSTQVQVTLSSAAGEVNCPGIPCATTVAPGSVNVATTGSFQLRRRVDVPYSPSTLTIIAPQRGQLGAGIALTTTGGIGLGVGGGTIVVGGFTALIGLFVAFTGNSQLLDAGLYTMAVGLGVSVVSVGLLVPGIVMTASAGPKVRVTPNVQASIVPIRDGAAFMLGGRF